MGWLQDRFNDIHAVKNKVTRFAQDKIIPAVVDAGKNTVTSQIRGVGGVLGPLMRTDAARNLRNAAMETIAPNLPKPEEMFIKTMIGGTSKPVTELPSEFIPHIRGAYDEYREGAEDPANAKLIEEYGGKFVPFDPTKPSRVDLYSGTRGTKLTLGNATVIPNNQTGGVNLVDTWNVDPAAKMGGPVNADKADGHADLVEGGPLASLAYSAFGPKGLNTYQPVEFNVPISKEDWNKPGIEPGTTPMAPDQPKLLSDLNETYKTGKRLLFNTNTAFPKHMQKPFTPEQRKGEVEGLIAKWKMPPETPMTYDEKMSAAGFGNLPTHSVSPPGELKWSPPPGMP